MWYEVSFVHSRLYDRVFPTTYPQLRLEELHLCLLQRHKCLEKSKQLQPEFVNQVMYSISYVWNCYAKNLFTDGEIDIEIDIENNSKYVD